MKKILLVCLLFIQGCSVYLAADGKKEPNLQGFHDGMSRFQVESVLGGPVSFTKKDDASIAVYEFRAGDEPSNGRAALWLFLDIIAAALPELFLTPYESNKGYDKRIKVTYDKQDIVTKLEI